ncbi:hypothetical protein ABEG18_14510 [Alsobacter sp. KACC 23698]|uniref:Uncharacterized protein n=1 Tax=Alsobacter sp. KACC 23698 TaxID=3149229 RepID=A0AAU7J9V8_9HYPH
MRGTLFRLFPQATDAYPEPELIEVSPLAGTVGPGPSDQRLVVVDAIDKAPYDPPISTPPYRGPVRPPAWPDAHGDFASIPVDTQQFLQAHLYGCVRLTLDVWEKYLGHPVRWLDLVGDERVELTPLVAWANAQSGPGFMEMGRQVNDEGELRLFCLNLDVVAHETGHTVLFAELGTPESGRVTPDFLAFHESVSDLTAMLTSLHFQAVVSHVLTQTNGNLYVLNDSNRIGELSGAQQIRIADNLTRISDVADLRIGPDGEWIDPTGRGRNAHALAQPLTGALFDFLIDLYQDNLVSEGVIGPDLDARGWDRDEVDQAMDALAAAFGTRLESLRGDFRAALLDARDALGRVLGEMLNRVEIEDLTFGRVAGVLLDVAAELVSPYAADMLAENLRWRGIEPEPTHRAAARSLLARAQTYRAGVPFAEQVGRVRALRRVACCLPGRHHESLHAAGLGQIIRAEHRRPA